MNSARDAFLRQVRQAVAAGNRPGSTTAFEPRAGIGYQGAGPDPTARFCEEFTAAGGIPHLVPDRAATVAKVLDLVRTNSVQRVLLGHGPVLDSLNLVDCLAKAGIEVLPVDALPQQSDRQALFQADLGISGVDYLVAETGTIALSARVLEPRSLSLLPPLHIAVADQTQIVPDLFDLFESIADDAEKEMEGPGLPSCLSLITGPSKTGDIELRLVTGVHGPGEIHLILLSAEEQETDGGKEFPRS